MPPESDSARDWQAWYREATDKAQVLSGEVAMLAKPLIDAPHRWDHGHPGDWCGTGGCRTLAHEQRGDRYVAHAEYRPDDLERSITSKLQDAVLAGQDQGGRMPTEVTVSGGDDGARPADYREGHERYAEGLEVRRREYSDDEQRHRYGAYRDGRDERRERAEREEDEWRRQAREQERDEEREAYRRQDAEHEPAVKHLASKVDQLQDEMSQLVKILARRKLARAEGGGSEHEDRGHEREREREREHLGYRREGEARVGRRPHAADKEQLAARHVVDWLRGATRAARV